MFKPVYSRKEIIEKIIAHGKTNRLPLSLTAIGDELILEGEKRIASSAFLWSKKPHKEKVTIVLKDEGFFVEIYAEVLNDVKQEEIIHMRCLQAYDIEIVKEGKALQATQKWGETDQNPVAEVVEMMDTLEYHVEHVIRRRLIDANRKKYAEKQKVMQKKGFDKPEEPLWTTLKMKVFEDVEKRVRKMVEAREEKPYGIDFDEFYRQLMTDYFGQCKLEFEIEQEGETVSDNLFDILYNHHRTGNPLFNLFNHPYAYVGNTAGQWAYIYYYARKGAAWFDYNPYCSMLDRLERNLIIAAANGEYAGINGKKRLAEAVENAAELLKKEGATC